MTMLEFGNTIDGIMIGIRVLNNLYKENTPHGKFFDVVQNDFYSWKRRQCHGCMIFIIDAKYGVACSNIANQ